MTKFLEISIAVLMLTLGNAFALENIPLPTGGGFYAGKVYQARLDSATGTTATASYAPRFIGELLLGKESGSNALWVARGLTTNDWGLVTAEGGPFSDTDIAADLAVGKLVLAAGKVIIGNAAGAGAAQTITGAISITTNGVVSLTSTAIAQVDTNATTTATTKTPAFAGQTLAGKVGGTNKVWIAAGTTTNDWVAVSSP